MIAAIVYWNSTYLAGRNDRPRDAGVHKAFALSVVQRTTDAMPSD